MRHMCTWPFSRFSLSPALSMWNRFSAMHILCPCRCPDDPHTSSTMHNATLAKIGLNNQQTVSGSGILNNPILCPDHDADSPPDDEGSDAGTSAAAEDPRLPIQTSKTTTTTTTESWNCSNYDACDDDDKTTTTTTTTTSPTPTTTDEPLPGEDEMGPEELDELLPTPPPQQQQQQLGRRLQGFVRPAVELQPEARNANH